MASSRQKRACVTCGKSKGKLFKETNTDAIVCSIDCAKEALKTTAVPEHVTVHSASPVGEALGMLHERIGSEMMAKLLKRDQKEYKWDMEGREHQVPAYLHNELDKHLSAKRKKEGDGDDDDDDDEEKEGGEKSRVRQEAEGAMSIIVSPAADPVPIPAIPLLNTQGKVATRLEELLPLDVWKTVLRQAGWEAFDALFDPYVIRWARESPIEFIQYVTDQCVYYPISKDYFVHILTKKKDAYDINAMFISVLTESSFAAQFMFSKHVAVSDGELTMFPFEHSAARENSLLIGYSGREEFPQPTATDEDVKLVIKAGHPVHFGPFPAWLFGRSVLLKSTIPALLERQPLNLPPDVVAMAAFADSASFDLYLEAAKKAGTNLKEIFAELYTRMEMLKANNVWKFAFASAIRLVADTGVFIANLEKLDDYGGKGASKVLKELKMISYINAYVKRNFPLVDMDELEEEYVANFIRGGSNVTDGYEDMRIFLNRKKSKNARISNEYAVSILALYIIDQIVTSDEIIPGDPGKPTDVAKRFITDCLEHITDISTLVTKASGRVEVAYAPIITNKSARWIMKKFTKAPKFTLTPHHTVAYRNMRKFVLAQLHPEHNRIVNLIKVAVPGNVVTPILSILLMDYSGPGDDVFFAKEYTDLGRISYFGQGRGYVRSFNYTCAENTYLQQLADELISTNPKARQVMTAQWIADRCDLFVRDNMCTALFALRGLADERKKLVAIYGQSEKATYDNLMENLKGDKLYIWNNSANSVQPVIIFDAVFTQLEHELTSPSDVITVRQLYVDALEMASNRMGEDDKQKFRAEMRRGIQNGANVDNVIFPETAILFAEKFGDRDFLISLSKTAKDMRVRLAAFQKLNYEKVEDWVEWLTSQHTGYRLDDSNRRMSIEMLRFAIGKFGGETVAAALKGGKFIHDFIFESYRDDLGFELVQILLPYYSMDTLFRNGDTFLHYLLGDNNPRVNPINLIEEYKKSFGTVPNLLALDSDGVSVIGRYYWKRESAERKTGEMLDELERRYPQFANTKGLPSTLLGIKNARTNFGTVDKDLVEKAKVFTGLKAAKALIDAKYPDGRWWWMSDNLLGGNELKRIMDMYKQNRAGISGTKKTPAGDTALHLYTKRRLSQDATDIVFAKSEMNEMFKIPDTNVSDKNNDGDTPVHIFIQRANKRDRRNVEVLKKLVQHNSFSSAATNKDGLTAKQLAARLNKPTFVDAFADESFSKSEVKSAINEEKMDDADEVVDSMQM